MKLLLAFISVFIWVTVSFAQGSNSFSREDLEKQKQEAIANEDFLKANEIKLKIEKFSTYQAEIEEYNKKIEQAVKAEDYVKAADLKSKRDLIYETMEKELKEGEFGKNGQSQQANVKSNGSAQTKDNVPSGSYAVSSEVLLDEIEEKEMPEVYRTDTIFYSENWYGVESFEECTFYRLVDFDKHNRIINPVHDYYKSGALEGMGYVRLLDHDDDSKTEWSGVVETYDEYTGDVTFRRDFSAVKGLVYLEGEAVQYYNHNNVIIAVMLSHEKQYGNYYTAYVTVTNVGDQEFLFDPEEIEAIFEIDGDIEYGDVLSHQEYMKKVTNRQAWNSALVAWGEVSAANQAGYSSASYTSNTYGYSSSYGSAFGYASDGRGNSATSNVFGSSSTSSYSTTSGTVSSYNGSDAYAAQQNAQNNINNFEQQQYQVKERLNQDYLKKNTIFPGQEIYGAINIKFKKAQKVYLRVPLNGETYTFEWGE
ncbi:MAG: UvrB/UvrC motif-containing protein [Flavobacteriales bacterium]|nr:UvrB/UvrC motif-containing protein [Flavobacteriales bacterium]